MVIKYEPNPSQVRELREISGSGIEECKRALEYSEGDMKVAFAFLKFYACAVYTKDYDRFLRMSIKNWVENNELPKR